MALVFSGQCFAATEKPQVVAAFPHDSGAYIQGLVWTQGRFFESTGLNGKSTLREVEVATGAVRRQVKLPDEYFGEGLALNSDKLTQITWKNGIAIVYAASDFKELTRFNYEGEGWGLCFDGDVFWMSDGSNQLVARDPNTFAVLRRVPVTANGVAVTNLNELECVGELVYANVYRTDKIVRVRKADGVVLTEIDASGLLTAEEQRNAEVLNGITYNPETRHFYITGKFWPKLFEVKFDFEPGGETPKDAGSDAAVGGAGGAGGTGQAGMPGSTGGVGSAGNGGSPSSAGASGHDHGSAGHVPGNNTGSKNSCACRSVGGAQGLAFSPLAGLIFVLWGVRRRFRSRNPIG